MSIQTSCPNCQAKFKLDAELSGKKVRCQKCKAIFTVTPLGEGSEPASPAAEPVAAPAAVPATSPAAAPGEVVFSAPTGSPGLGNLLLQDLLGGNDAAAAKGPTSPSALPAAPMIDDLEEVLVPPAASPVPASTTPPRSSPPPVPNAPPLGTPAASPPASSSSGKRRFTGWSAGSITLVTILYLSMFLGGIGGLWALAARRANDVSLRIPRHFRDGNRAVAIPVTLRPDFFQHTHLDFNDPQLNGADGFTRYKVYEVTFEANQNYFIEMRSHNFSTRLVLLDENGAEVAQFEGPNNWNFNESRATLNYFAPRRGKHLLLATGRRNGGVDPWGAFDLRIRPENAVEKK